MWMISVVLAGPRGLRRPLLSRGPAADDDQAVVAHIAER
jgi:hypothetical protein